MTAGKDRVKGLSYWDKGWTSFEFALAMMIKPANSSMMKDWAQVVDLGETGDKQQTFRRPALSEPLAFFEEHAYGAKTYTNGADRDGIVAPKFRETTFDLLGGVRELNFGKLGWGDAELKAFAVVLPLCGQLEKLFLHENTFGNPGMIAFAEALKPTPEIPMGALAHLTLLQLGKIIR